jgi:hypothetical protein
MNKTPSFNECFLEALWNKKLSVDVKLIRYLASDKASEILSGQLELLKHSPNRTIRNLIRTIGIWISRLKTEFEKIEIKNLAEENDVLIRADSNSKGFGKLWISSVIFLGEIIKKVFTSLFRHDEWNIGYAQTSIERFTENNFETEIRWLFPSKRNVYRADPFGYKYDGQIRIYYEFLEHSTFKGEIFTGILDSGKILDIQKHINFEEHLSYPYILEFNDKLYGVPESANTYEVRLYEIDKTTGQWTYVKNILTDFAALDSSLIYFNGSWWLFCTNKDFNPRQDLFIFYSDSLLGEWKPHRLNPVKHNIFNSRPGGTPFVNNGILYRPTQDGSGSYGKRIVINRILQLSKERFEEEICRIVEPAANSTYTAGIHTLSSVGRDLTFLDGKRLVFSTDELIRKIKNYLR